MAKLDESDITIQKEVLNAYRICEDGRTRTWATKMMLSILAFKSNNEKEYLQNMHSLLLSVMCTMVKDGKLKVINVK